MPECRHLSPRTPGRGRSRPPPPSPSADGRLAASGGAGPRAGRGQGPVGGRPGGPGPRQRRAPSAPYRRRGGEGGAGRPGRCAAGVPACLEVAGVVRRAVLVISRIRPATVLTVPSHTRDARAARPVPTAPRPRAPRPRRPHRQHEAPRTGEYPAERRLPRQLSSCLFIIRERSKQFLMCQQL